MLLAVAVLAIPAQKKLEEQLPPIAGLVKSGCTAAEDSQGLWHVDRWADYADGRQQQHSVHGWAGTLILRETRELALKDCNQYMKSIEKLQQKGKKKK